MAVATRRAYDRMPSVDSLATVGNTSMTPSTAPSSAFASSTRTGGSLYQNCMTVLALLRRVPNFKEKFLDTTSSSLPNVTSSSSSISPVSPGPDSLAPIVGDPVSQLATCLRLGSPLCFLFNLLGRQKQLEVNYELRRSNLKACQRSAAHFIMACKQELGWQDGDLFTITQLYDTDTNGTVKVVHTVKKLVFELEHMGILDPLQFDEAEGTQEVVALDDRAKVVRELLESERKYVQDMEELQEYQRRLQQEDLISQDTIHRMFINLNVLIDFQRRFLIGIEATASQPPDEQRFGLLFIQMEDGFRCYEPYCANYTSANDIASIEGPSLPPLSGDLPNPYLLLAALIKPVQRICKYPLLVQQLVKTTDSTSPYYNELVEGLETIKRITDRVNETKRKQENDLAVQELARRVEDWKGHDINAFGELLLEEVLPVIKNDTEKEYHVYLFEKIILCCKEVGGQSKKNSKSNSMLKKSGMKRKPELQLKGRIYLTNISGLVPQASQGSYMLKVTWRGDGMDESFFMRCKNDETLKKWQKAISKANEEYMNRRSFPQFMSSSSGSLRRVPSPYSTFPATPQSELGQVTPGGSYHEMSSNHHASLPYLNGNPYATNGGVNGDEHEYVTDSDNGGYSGRVTPSNMRRGPLTRSLPPGEREREIAGRPRAQTEDSSSQVINQWRSQTPVGLPAVPALPRGASITSNTSDGYPSSNGTQSLRSSASSRNLRHKQSHEWGSAGFTRLPSDGVQEDAYAAADVSRQGSQAGLPAVAPSMSLRSRSASSPNIYQNANGSQWNPYPDTSIPSVPPLNINHKNSTAASSSATVSSTATASTAANGNKRFSSSSTGTDGSSDNSSQSQGQSTSATSPGSMNHPSSRLTNGSSYSSSGGYKGGAVKIKLSVGEDTLTIVVLANIAYRELVDKIIKKIRLCGDRQRADESLRLRYEDEDGDKILISGDDDVAMALESSSPHIFVN